MRLVWVMLIDDKDYILPTTDCCNTLVRLTSQQSDALNDKVTYLHETLKSFNINASLLKRWFCPTLHNTKLLSRRWGEGVKDS